MKKGEIKIKRCIWCNNPFKIHCWQQDKLYCEDRCRVMAKAKVKKYKKKEILPSEQLTIRVLKFLENQRQLKLSTLTKKPTGLYWDK